MKMLFVYHIIVVNCQHLKIVKVLYLYWTCTCTSMYTVYEHVSYMYHVSFIYDVPRLMYKCTGSYSVTRTLCNVISCSIDNLNRNHFINIVNFRVQTILHQYYLKTFKYLEDFSRLVSTFLFQMKTMYELSLLRWYLAEICCYQILNCLSLMVLQRIFEWIFSNLQKCTLLDEKIDKITSRGHQLLSILT